MLAPRLSARRRMPRTRQKPEESYSRDHEHDRDASSTSSRSSDANSSMGPKPSHVFVVRALAPTGPRRGNHGMQSSDKTCPMCAETVKSAARVCRFCGHRFDTGEMSPPSPAVPVKAVASQEEQVARWGAGLALVAASLMLVGALMPWDQAYDSFASRWSYIPGYDHQIDDFPSGIFVTAGALVQGFLAVMLLSQKSGLSSDGRDSLAGISLVSYLILGGIAWVAAADIGFDDMRFGLLLVLAAVGMGCVGTWRVFGAAGLPGESG